MTYYIVSKNVIVYLHAMVNSQHSRSHDNVINEHTQVI